MDSSTDSLSVLPPPASTSAVLLTPGRTRNIALDMEALRLSRQDNPYLQQVMASRESLIESHHTEQYESDDTILMSQEFGSTALELVEEDPLTLKEVHDHMIRSPPPITAFPHEACRAGSAFDFATSPLSFSAYSVDSHDKDFNRPRRGYKGDGTRSDEFRSSNSTGRARSSRSVSPRSHDGSSGRPLSLPGENHLRAKAKAQNDRFPILQATRPLRRPQRGDDSVRLVPHWDK